MLPIAILSSNIDRTVEWLKKEYDIKTINLMERRITLINDQVLIIVTNSTMLLGYEFAGYRRAPDFETLEDLVKLRVKK